MYGDVEWIAADLEIDPTDSYLTGTLGFSSKEVVRRFNDDKFSWLKSEAIETVGAKPTTVVPFAVDIRDDRRYVAFATTGRIPATRFAFGFERALRAATERLQMVGAEWDVDLMPDVSTVRQWIATHPNIIKITRGMRRHNPVDHINDDRAEMRAYGARRKDEVLYAALNSTLKVNDNDWFEAKLQSMFVGDVDLRLEAREGETVVRYSSKKKVDSVHVDDYRQDLELGIALVLAALRLYEGSSGRGS